MFPSIKIVEAIRKEYPAGTRVRLVKMDDIQAAAESQVILDKISELFEKDGDSK